MNCRRSTSLVLAGLLISGTASAATLTSTVGDRDLLGGSASGTPGTVTSGFFDNRSAAEAAATNGAQNTDRSDGTFGIVQDFTDFVFDFGGAISGTITSVTFNLGIGGLQSNDNNPLTKSSGEDGLFVDGQLAADVFEPLNQGNNGFDYFSFSLDSNLFANFIDGLATLRIDTNSNGGTIPGGGSSPVWYDFAEVVIETNANGTIPLPAGLPLLLTAFGGLAVLRRRKS